MAAELTASSRDDASTLPALLDTIEVPIRRFTADEAYDHRSVYDQLSAAGTENVVIVIPPRRSALSAGPTDGPWAQRDTGWPSSGLRPKVRWSSVVWGGGSYWNFFRTIRFMMPQAMSKVSANGSPNTIPAESKSRAQRSETVSRHGMYSPAYV